MNVLYHLTVLPPKLPQAEALSQEIDALRSHFSGEIVHLNPNRRATGPIPRLLFGFQRLADLRRREADIHLHHIYNPDPFPFPVLRLLRRPVVYTISSGWAGQRLNRAFFNRLAAVTAPDARSVRHLRAAGLTNVHLVRPGVDVARFTHTPPPPLDRLRLLAASAPWTEEQFASKGVDALLEAARREPRLELVFLWRGVLTEAMQGRVRRLGLADRVTVIDRLVDVNQVLARVHAVVCLASRPGIVKSYPHSLLDGLAAGRPVLVSQAIPMADYVAETGCGQVVEAVTPEAILDATARLRGAYTIRQQAAQAVGRRDFDQARMVADYREVYLRATASRGRDAGRRE